MTLPLSGRVAALAETRQLEELVAMLEKEGATTVRVPMFAILDADNQEPVVAWLRDLVAGKFHLVAFMTGEGVRRLVAAGERAGFRDDVVAALGRTRLITRGPKPGQALKEIGLAPSKVAAAPTTAGLKTTLAAESLAGAHVGLQLHDTTDDALPKFLADSGAIPHVVRPYQYAPAVDAYRVMALIRDMAAGTVDLLVITSSPQISRLYEVAETRGILAELAIGLGKTCVAAVGPIAAESLVERGARADIVPAQGFVMKNLVQQIKRELDAKRPR